MASLKDKSLNHPPPEPAEATRGVGRGGGATKDANDRQSEGEPMDSSQSPKLAVTRGGQAASPGLSGSGYKRKHVVLLEEEKEEEERRVGRKGLKPGADESRSGPPLRQAELLPQATIDSLRRRAADHPSPGAGRRITADQLSVALGNIVGGSRGEISPKLVHKEGASSGSPATTHSSVTDNAVQMKEITSGVGKMAEHKAAPLPHPPQPSNSSQRRAADPSAQLHLSVR